MRLPALALLIPLLICFGVAAAESVAPPAGGIALLPGRIELSGRAATQRLLVEAVGPEGFTGPAPGPARFTSSNPKVAVVDAGGVVRAVGDGAATITATVGETRTEASVRVAGAGAAFTPSFRNHVEPVLAKNGCSSGACHGALAGKGGLKLSLRGYDPAADHDVLTRQAFGRRVVKATPERSLVLLKPLGKIPHGGGVRIRPGSFDARVLAAWITSGAPRPLPSDPVVERLEVFPDRAMLRPGQTQPVLVRAVYSDGRKEDVTHWTKFGSSDTTVVSVDDGGTAKMEAPGEAAVTVWFNNRVAFARLAAPYPDPVDREAFTRAARHNFVDDPVLRKLQALNIPPSPLADDRTFLRRAFLDSIGVLPTAAEVSAFVQDTTPDKRAKLIDRLLERPEFVDYWSYKWSDLLLVSTRKLPAPAMQAFSGWVRASVAANKPWDHMARELITATGSNLDNGAANYWVLHKETADLTETTSQALLGMSLTCARCHNHPNEKWTQNQYYQFANLFTRIRLKNGDRTGETLVLAADTGDIPHPRLGRPLPPAPLDGEPMSANSPADRRAALAAWLTAPDNPYFARALVNRVWRNFMGRGLVEAEDDLRLTNPPSNEDLMAALTRDFVAHRFDIKHLIRTIMTSATYQRSSEPEGQNASDRIYYSHYLPRRLPAEVILDGVSQVTGVPTAFEGYAAGTRALQLPDSRVTSYFLTAFGRPERAQTCACERQQEPSVAQALHLANGDTINNKLRAKGSIVDTLIANNATDDEALDTLYLSALARTPTEAERAKLKAALSEPAPAGVSPADARRQALEDLYWATLTRNEFLFNH